MCIELVEDHPLIQELVADSLRSAGLDVEEASDATTAMAVFDADRHKFKLLITDLQLGDDIGGAVVAHHVRRAGPLVPVVMVSGDPGALEADCLPSTGFVPFHKPLRVGELVRLVYLLLGLNPDAAPNHGPVLKQ